MKSIPDKDAEFHVAQEIISSAANSNLEDWNIDSAWFTNHLTPAKDKWFEAWGNYQDRAMRTPLITFVKNEARKEYEKLLRILVKGLQHNTRVSEDDLKKIGIAIRRQGRMPAPVPETYPVFTVDSSILRRLAIHYRDNAGTSNAKPRGVHGVEIKWGIMDIPAPGPGSLPNSSIDTRTPFTIEFTDDDRGKTVYFCLRWENTTGAKGPWGEIGMAIVP